VDYMEIMEKFKKKARSNRQTIVLPEGDDERIVNAAEAVLKDKLANLIILANDNEINQIASANNLNLDDATIIDPKNSDLINEFTDLFYELRKHKGISKEDAKKIIKDPLYFATMLIYTNRAQGLVAGAANATGDVLRPAFQIIKTTPGISVVSGAFIMDVPDCNYGEDGVLFFADCAVNPSPDKEQLAEIALTTADTANKLLDIDPHVALLSFSTKGSTSHELVDKVAQAVKIAKEKDSNIKIDGELQADAALIPDVAKRKSPESEIAGKANVLIFPDLQSGNIGYKLVQRLAGAKAIGPVLQGIAKPVNDLSRGCSVQDIVNVVAITAVQAQNLK